MTASAKLWPVAASVFGAATLALLLGFSFLPSVRDAFGADFARSMSAFQRASGAADLVAVFGATPNEAKLEAMTDANRLDLFGFIPAYSLFLIAAAAMLAGGVRKPLAWLAIIPTLIGAGADIMETAAQLRITADYANAGAYLPLAPLCWTKYFALAFAGLGMSAICFLGDHKRWILGVLGFIPIAGAFVDWLGLFDIPSLTALGAGVLWAPLLFVAIAESLAKRA